MTKYKYAAGYCEENVWHLIDHKTIANTDKMVVWITGMYGACPLWHQRAAPQPDHPVWWDYHVILMVRFNQWSVWDLDCTLGMDVHLASYLTQTFQYTDQDTPMFRLMDAEYYQRIFSSDRSHMRASDGGWLAAPPDWPPICQSESTFSEIRDFQSDLHGSIVNIDGLRRNYC